MSLPHSEGNKFPRGPWQKKVDNLVYSWQIFHQRWKKDYGTVLTLFMDYILEVGIIENEGELKQCRSTISNILEKGGTTEDRREGFRLLLIDISTMLYKEGENKNPPEYILAVQGPRGKASLEHLRREVLYRSEIAEREGDELWPPNP